jgi:predicted ATPase
VGIEEPESGLHPGATGILFECLEEASETRQVIVTSHSPDLLDRDNVNVDDIRAVEMRDGVTLIGPVDDAAKRILSRKLRTAGELLRDRHLTPAVAESPVATLPR